MRKKHFHAFPLQSREKKQIYQESMKDTRMKNFD